MTIQERPTVVILAGPNGAGKSTLAPMLLADTLGIAEFVNADTIAAGLSAFNPAAAAIAAGRVTLARLRELARQRLSFAFETTLASRSYATWLRQLAAEGYDVRLVFLWLPSADLAVARVAERVRRGGHGIPEEVIRRRYAAGSRNFSRRYRSILSSWTIYENASLVPVKVADGAGLGLRVHDAARWSRFMEQAG